MQRQRSRKIERAADIDALVTDLPMPGMNGMELIVAARNRRPELPAILLADLVAPDASQLNSERRRRAKAAQMAKLFAQPSVIASERM